MEIISAFHWPQKFIAGLIEIRVDYSNTSLLKKYGISLFMTTAKNTLSKRINFALF